MYRPKQFIALTCLLDLLFVIIFAALLMVDPPSQNKSQRQLNDSAVDVSRLEATVKLLNEKLAAATKMNQFFKKQLEQQKRLSERNGNVVTKQISGVYHGSYLCTQGKTSLKLTLWPSQNGLIRGIFDFRFKNITGSYLVTGPYLPSKSLILSGVRWLSRPPTYRMVGLKGVAVNGVYSGSTPSCAKGQDTFHVIKAKDLTKAEVQSLNSSHRFPL